MDTRQKALAAIKATKLRLKAVETELESEYTEDEFGVPDNRSIELQDEQGKLRKKLQEQSLGAAKAGFLKPRETGLFIFSTGEVRKLTGFTYRQLDYFEKEGRTEGLRLDADVYKPQKKGQPKLYSINRVISLLLLRRLKELGYSQKRVLDVARTYSESNLELSKVYWDLNDCLKHLGYTSQLVTNSPKDVEFAKKHNLATRIIFVPELHEYPNEPDHEELLQLIAKNPDLVLGFLATRTLDRSSYKRIVTERVQAVMEELRTQGSVNND